MITIKLKNLEESEAIYIHDSHLTSINCDYYNQTFYVVLDMKGVYGYEESGIKTASFEFVKTKNVSLSFLRPWGGKGWTIVSLSIRPNFPENLTLPEGVYPSNCFYTEFITDAGDILGVISEGLKYKTYK